MKQMQQNPRMKCVHKGISRSCESVKDKLRKFLRYHDEKISDLSISKIDDIETYDWDKILDIQDKVCYFNLGEKVGYEKALMQLSVSVLFHNDDKYIDKQEHENLFVHLLSQSVDNPNFRYLNHYTNIDDKKREELEQYYFENIW